MSDIHRSQLVFYFRKLDIKVKMCSIKIRFPMCFIKARFRELYGWCVGTCVKTIEACQVSWKAGKSCLHHPEVALCHVCIAPPIKGWQQWVRTIPVKVWQLLRLKAFSAGLQRSSKFHSFWICSCHVLGQKQSYWHRQEQDNKSVKYWSSYSW